MTKAKQKDIAKAIIKAMGNAVGEAKVCAEKPDATDEEKADYIKRLDRMDGAVFMATFLEVVTAVEAIQQENEGIKEGIVKAMPQA